LDCPVLVKSLRRSINDFIAKNEEADIHGENGRSIELLDYTGESWKKYRQRLETFDVNYRI
jgi:hypothetical protein